MPMPRATVRLLVYRQIKLEHPEYSEQRLQREVDTIVDLIDQVEEAHKYHDHNEWLAEEDL